MTEALRTNVGVLLKFYARNRLLIVIALIFLLLAALTVSMSLVYGSTSDHFEIISSALSTLNGFTLILAAGLGLFAISSHLRQRSLKMVLTKPCLPEVWIGAVFASALVVAALLYGLNLLFGLVLSLVWGVPVQSGLFFLPLEGLLRSAIALSYLSFLTIFLHPAVAVLVVLFFNEGTFDGLRQMLLTAIKTNAGNPLLPVLEWLTKILYMVLPTFHPYETRLEGVSNTLRASASDWLTLAKTAGYAATALGLFFCLAVAALRRRNLA
jgi:ABC-type transport system involved in multi-copper enzyme maturation permease subunit